MARDHTKARKAFIIERLGGTGKVEDDVLTATLETHPSRMFQRDMPDELREIYLKEGFEAEGLKLTMPDGSEWFIDDLSITDVLASVREYRLHRDAAAAQTAE